MLSGRWAGSRHPLPYGKQQLTGPRRFRFVKSAVLKIGSGVGGRGGGEGQLHFHLPAARVQLHRQHVTSKRRVMPSAARVNRWDRRGSRGTGISI